mmetsp:Transcript_30803/g.49721  ORF Transcript_30803/g.49721 Transcript_30803/m.49721 type:complete len:302 (-) Transcript_30803:1022-1927(-)
MSKTTSTTVTTTIKPPTTTIPTSIKPPPTTIKSTTTTTIKPPPTTTSSSTTTMATTTTSSSSSSLTITTTLTHSAMARPSSTILCTQRSGMVPTLPAMSCPMTGCGMGSIPGMNCRTRTRSPRRTGYGTRAIACPLRLGIVALRTCMTCRPPSRWCSVTSLAFAHPTTAPQPARCHHLPAITTCLSLTGMTTNHGIMPQTLEKCIIRAAAVGVRKTSCVGPSHATVRIWKDPSGSRLLARFALSAHKPRRCWTRRVRRMRLEWQVPPLQCRAPSLPSGRRWPGSFGRRSRGTQLLRKFHRL